MDNVYNTYVNYIATFVNNDINQWNFKSHPHYRYVLEHVFERQGNEYLIEISRRFNEVYTANKDYLIELCHMNDSVGQPVKYNLSNFTQCSPTNMRYILHSFLILTHMKECLIDNVDIIEIGGGYGGLCFFIHKLAHLFGITIRSYCIFDLPAPLYLQRKYLENLQVFERNREPTLPLAAKANNFELSNEPTQEASYFGVNYAELNNIKNLYTHSYLISNYAFSEISRELQAQYTEYVINPYTSYGFLAWNMIEVYNFVDNAHIIVEDEVPLTSRTNKYVYYTK